MKTRQQRLAEERAGHPPSPPQELPGNPRGPRRTRAKTPSATVAVGSVEPAAQPAVPGEPHALLQVWADAARAGDDPTHTFVVSMSRLPEVMACLKAKGTNQGGPGLPGTSTASAQATNSSSMNQSSQSMSPPLELLTRAELPHNLRNQAHLPAYTKDGMVLYGLAREAPTPGLVASSKNSQMAQGPPLTQITRTAPIPKKATSMPASAKAKRAKSRQQSGLLAKPIKGGQKPRGKKASPKKSPAVSPIHRDEEEVQQAKIGESNQPILWPSRNLERIQTSQKRKRWGEPVEQEPVKLRRIGDKRYFSSQQSQAKTPIAITNPAGTFKVPSPSDSDWSDSDEGERGFRVPSPSDSDASDGDEEEANAIAKANENFGPAGGQKFHAYQQWCKTATPAVVAALEGMEVDPQIAGEAFERGFEKFKASGYTFKSLPENLQPFTPLSQYGISPRVEAYLDSQWDEDDQRAAVTGFEKGFQIFEENGADADAAAIST